MDYLLLPLRSASLILIMIFSALLAFASIAGFFGIPLGLILVSWFFKYSFVLLDSTAEGVTEPPVLSIEMVNPVNEQRPLVLLLFAGAMFLLSDAIGHWFGPTTGTLAAIIAVLVVPAIVGVQGASGSVLQSFNPIVVAALITRLRSDYLVILGCVAVFAGLSRIVVSARWGIDLPLTVQLALLMYFWLASYALIGGVLFTRREDIGLEAMHAPERIEARANLDVDRERSRRIDSIYAEWRGGARANAWQTVMTQVDASADPVDELRWLHESAARWPDPRLANRIANELLPRLLAARQFSEALAIAQSRISRDPEFRPRASADLLTLVRLARDAGDRPTARTLLVDFERFFPEDKELRAAQALTVQLER